MESGLSTVMLNKIFRFWRWHPEVALRYLPIVKAIKKIKSWPSCSILEVGSGWLGISPYLGRKIIGLDEDFENKQYFLTKQVKGNILKIPFKKDSFDIVICTDVLEHIDNNNQDKAIAELLRICKKYLFIGIPTGAASLNQDILLNKIYGKKYNKNFLFLSQHLANGLPDVGKTLNLIKKNAEIFGKKIKIKTTANENLNTRLFLMKGWITKNKLKDFFFRKIMLFFLPVLVILEQPDYYRTSFFVTIEA